jgi:hypothetical protein
MLKLEIASWEEDRNQKSRSVKKEFPDRFAQFYWKDALWSIAILFES